MQNTALCGAYIRISREKQGWSLRELATKAGVSHTTIDNIEKGYDPRTGRECNVTLDTLQKIAAALSIPAEHMLACLSGNAHVTLKRPTDTWHDDLREDMEHERGGVREYLRLKWGDGSIEFPAVSPTISDEHTAKLFLFDGKIPADDDWRQVLQFVAYLKHRKSNKT